MRIFVLLSRIPYPLEKGDKLRAFHQIKVLSEKHEIILCALNPIRKTDKQKAFALLQPYCRSVTFIDLPFSGRIINILKAFLKGLPFQIGYFYSSRAARKIDQLIEQHQPQHLYGQLARTARYLMNKPLPKTIDYQDAFAHGLKRRAKHAGFFLKAVLWMEYHRMAAFESFIFDHFDGKTIISEQDKSLISHEQKQSIVVVRNGVDMEYFKPMKQAKTHEIVFTGNMNYPPNVDAAQFLAQEIMPLVWEKIPGAKLLLAGAHPHPKVRQLVNEKVRVSGWLDDIRTAYAGAEVFIAPMRMGTGLQNKLLEAMAMKIPTLTTPLANAALHAENGKEIFIGKDAHDLAQQIIKLLNNPSLQIEIAENAYSFIRKSFQWDQATAPLELLITKNTALPSR
jgi:sugar transferase (PEP-CTERM/EpsH1 system associated)